MEGRYDGRYGAQDEGREKRDAPPPIRRLMID